MSRPTWSRLLASAVAAGVALAGVAGVARAGESAAPPRTVKVSWQIVADDRSIGTGCSVTAYLQITAVPGAMSYAVTIVDSATGTYNLSGPPFPGDKVDVGGQVVRAPAGKHRWGLSSYGATTRDESCAQAMAGFLNGKRWQVTSATATVAGKADEVKPGSIAGRVVETECDDRGCTGKGLPGVVVAAAGTGGGSATTKGDGRYSIEVEPGRYRVTPSLQGREFEPVSSQVTVAKGETAPASFSTCAEGRETQSARAGGRAASVCKLEVKVRNPSVEMSGKQFLGAKQPIPVGFVQSTKDGDFAWYCRSGCVNVRVSLRDPKTNGPPESARVTVTANVDGNVVTKNAPDGVLCRAVDAYLKKGCSAVPNLSAELSKTGDFDFYYWLPGVIEKSTATLHIAVRAPGYPRVLKTVIVTVKPNVAFEKTLELTRHTASELLWYGSLMKGVAIGEFSEYCKAMLEGLSEKGGLGLSAGEKAALLWVSGKAKLLAKGCGVLSLPDIVSRLGPVAPWKLWLTFRPRFGFAPNGLLGTSLFSDRVLQFFFNYSGFFEAFDKGLVDYLYQGLDPRDPDKATPSEGSRITLKVWEVSHRLPSGVVQDALYLKLAGVKHRSQTTPYVSYIEGGYWPGCWLDPKLANAEFSFIDIGACRNQFDSLYISGQQTR